MTVHARIVDDTNDLNFKTEPTDQVQVFMMWESREKWYNISRVFLTHNSEYPTPSIHVIAPNPGIRFTVSDQDGNVLYTNYKPKETE